MAYHNNTPETVLNAPTLLPRWFVVYTAPNRASRRHDPKVFAEFLKTGQLPGRNVPYIRHKKPEVE